MWAYAGIVPRAKGVPAMISDDEMLKFTAWQRECLYRQLMTGFCIAEKDGDAERAAYYETRMRKVREIWKMPLHEALYIEQQTVRHLAQVDADLERYVSDGSNNTIH